MRPIQSIITGTAYTGGGIDLDYPTPGSGNFRTAAVALSGISFADIGAADYASGGQPSVGSPVAGLWRSKYDGNFCAGALNTVGSYDLNWFTGKTPLKSVADGFLSWGSQTDGPGLGQHNFSMEWKGYISLPSAVSKWNFYVESDDTCAVWIGTEAVSGFDATNCLVSSSNKGLPTDAAVSRSSKTLIFNPGFYPIRIWYSEFTGGCKFQLYALGEDGTKLSGDEIGKYYNNSTKGYDP